MAARRKTKRGRSRGTGLSVIIWQQIENDFLKGMSRALILEKYKDKKLTATAFDAHVHRHGLNERREMFKMTARVYSHDQIKEYYENLAQKQLEVRDVVYQNSMIVYDDLIKQYHSSKKLSDKLRIVPQIETCRKMVFQSVGIAERVVGFNDDGGGGGGGLTVPIQVNFYTVPDAEDWDRADEE